MAPARQSDGSREFLTPAVDTLPINVAVLDADGYILETNDAWEQFGRENDIGMRPDTTGVNYLEVTRDDADEHAQRAAEGLRSVLEGSKELFTMEYPCHSPTEDRWFLLRAAEFTHDGSRYVSVAHVDITDRRKREETIRAKYRRYETLTETAPDAIFLVSLDTYELVQTNPEASSLTGYTQAELSGMSYRELHPPGERYDSFLESYSDRVATADSKSTTVTEFEDGSDIEVQTRTGDRRSVEINASLVELENEQLRGDGASDELVLAIFRDVTQRRQYERQLETQRDQLELLNQVVRHDIRNDLQLVLTYSDILERTVADSDAQTHVEKIRESAENAVELTTTAREVAEIMLRSEEDTTAIALRPTIQREIADLRSSYPAACVTVEGDIPDVEVEADEMLGSVLSNLLSNAVQHNDKSEPTVWLSVTERENDIVVRVADNGPGIPDDQKEQIFGRGEKGLESEGTGVGLYLVNTLVEQYGGTVWIEDNDPVGAVFFLTLPRVTRDRRRT